MTFVVITSSERMTFDIIGRHFTANTSVLLLLLLLLLSLMAIWLIAVSSVPHTLSYLWWSVTISKLTATNRFSKRLIHPWINSTPHFKFKCSADFYMNLSLKRTDRLQKIFDVIFIVFPVMPDKVAFVSATALISLQTLPGKRVQQRLPMAENKLAFSSLWETLVSDKQR